jgi:filamentous hemagglutinin
VLNVLVGAVTGLGGTTLTRESLAAASEELRKITIENSRLSPGVVDDYGEGDTFILSNFSGESMGGKWDLDPTKTGGTRIDLDALCGSDNKRCMTKDDGNGNQILDLKDGMVRWNREEANGKSLPEWLMDTDEGRKMAGTFGDIQGIKGSIFGIEYAAGSWLDQLVEAFGGPHDFIGGQVTGLYDEQGNLRRDMTGTERKTYDVWSAVALVPSAPFAAATLLPPEVWKAISIMLEGAK